jgi:hypothetical protein
MSDLTIQWPDANAERVEAAKGRLDVARRRLSARSREGILAVLGTVLEQWRDPKSKCRQRLLAEFPAQSGFSPPVVSAGLDLALDQWTGEALAQAIEAELDPPGLAPPHQVSPFSMTSVILAGAIPMPNLLGPLLPLCVQSPVLVKSASRDAVTPGLLAESVAAVDPELGRCIEVVSFNSDDEESLGRFLAAECVVASGSDETIAAIGRRIRPSQRFVAYGHKLSLAVVNAERCGEDWCQQTAEALALDIALWDQLGCLSPAAVFVLGRDAENAGRTLSHALAQALERLQTALPRGEVSLETAASIHHEREEARMRGAGGADVRVHASEGTDWTVIAEPDAQWRPGPLHRFIRVHALARLEQLGDALRPVVRNLSSVALAGFEAGEDKTAEITRELSLLGAARLCPPGRLQAPPIGWRHDGRPLVLPLARFTGLELPSA